MLPLFMLQTEEPLPIAEAGLAVLLASLALTILWLLYLGR